MPVAVSFEMSDEDLRALRRRLNGLGTAAPKIMGAAIRDSGREVQRRATRITAKAMGVKQKDLRNKKTYGGRRVMDLELHRASGNVDGYRFRVLHSPFPARMFSPRQTRRGVSYRNKGERTLIESAFIVDKFGGNVFTRDDDADDTLDKRFGTSPGWEAGRDPDLERYATTERTERLAQFLDRRIGRELARRQRVKDTRGRGGRR